MIRRNDQKGLMEIKENRIFLTQQGADYINIVSCHNKKVAYHILNADGIAFDHAKILAFAIERLRG
jgi:hypothetical protein